MNKKYFVLIIIAIVLISTVLVTGILQLSKQNSTVIADSFELQIKDLMSPNSNEVTFNRIDSSVVNKTVMDLVAFHYINYNSVSESTFIGYITDCLLADNQAGDDLYTANVLRLENTFYLTTEYSYLNNGKYVYNNISVSCSPSHTQTLLPTVSRPSPSPTPFSSPTSLGFIGNSEQISMTNVVFNSNNQLTVTIQNTGSSTVTIMSAFIDGNTATMNQANPFNVVEGTSGQLAITSRNSFVAGAQYQIKLITAEGNSVVMTASYNP